MAEYVGFNKKIAVSTDGITYTVVGELLDASYPDEGDLLDSTSGDDGGYKAELGGLKARRLTFSVNYDEADIGQNHIRTAGHAKSKLYWRYRPMGDTAGNAQHLFQGTPKVDEDTPIADLIKMSVDVRTSGVITVSSVP